MKKSLLTSTIVHLLLLSPLLLSKGIGDQKKDPSKKFPNKTTGSDHTHIIPKTMTMVELFDATPPKDGLKSNKKKALKKECPKAYYGGIGITMSGMDNHVTEVVEGYPANRANIEVGDILSSEEEITGTIGTQVVIKVLKSNGTSLTKTLIREKICTEH